MNLDSTSRPVPEGEEARKTSPAAVPDPAEWLKQQANVHVVGLPLMVKHEEVERLLRAYGQDVLKAAAEVARQADEDARRRFLGNCMEVLEVEPATKA